MNWKLHPLTWVYGVGFFLYRGINLMRLYRKVFPIPFRQIVSITFVVSLANGERIRTGKKTYDIISEWENGN